ncbi:hypothetical protein KAU43_06715, partial [candidate division WOR-3 bacterium]|nr:hypothetical protein [candidate division WOR-3 bacterium]
QDDREKTSEYGRHSGLPIQFTIYSFRFTNKDHVIANEVKQSHKSKFRLLSCFTHSNDNFPNLQFTIYAFCYWLLPLDICNRHMSIPIYWEIKLFY